MQHIVLLRKKGAVFGTQIFVFVYAELKESMENNQVKNNIRLATLNDAPRILEIYAPYILDSPISFETVVPSLEEFQQRMRETQTKFPWLVYESNNHVVGYTYASPHRSRCAYEWSVESAVYTDAKYQGQGIGTQLYGELFRMLKAQGVVNIFAGITQPNEASVGLHQSVGFAPIGCFKDVGFKQGKWWDVGWWQLQLQKPAQPKPLVLTTDHL